MNWNSYKAFHLHRLPVVRWAIPTVLRYCFRIRTWVESRYLYGRRRDFGYCAMGSMCSVTNPATTRIRARTVANIGLFMKNFTIAFYFIGLILIPSLTFSRAVVTYRSSGRIPLMTCRAYRPPTVRVRYGGIVRYSNRSLYREFSQLVGPDRGVAHEDSVFLFAVGQGDCNIQPTFQFAVFIFEIGADVQRTGRQVDVGRGSRVSRYNFAVRPVRGVWKHG